MIFYLFFVSLRVGNEDNSQGATASKYTRVIFLFCFF